MTCTYVTIRPLSAAPDSPIELANRNSYGFRVSRHCKHTHCKQHKKRRWQQSVPTSKPAAVSACSKYAVVMKGESLRQRNGMTMKAWPLLFSWALIFNSIVPRSVAVGTQFSTIAQTTTSNSADGSRVRKSACSMLGRQGRRSMALTKSQGTLSNCAFTAPTCRADAQPHVSLASPGCRCSPPGIVDSVMGFWCSCSTSWLSCLGRTVLFACWFELLYMLKSPLWM